MVVAAIVVMHTHVQALNGTSKCAGLRVSLLKEDTMENLYDIHPAAIACVLWFAWVLWRGDPSDH